MSEPKPDKRLVRCTCGARMRVPAACVGRKGECTKCGRKMIIRADGSTEGVEPQPPPPATIDCPHCRKALPKTALFCGSCGYDFRLRGVPRDDLPGAGALSAASDTAEPGTFAGGLAYSAGAALAGGLAWWLLAWALGHEVLLRPVAAALGALAGWGMRRGWGIQCAPAGIGAAGSALGAMFLAQALIGATLPDTPVFAGKADADDRLLAENLVFERLCKERGLDSGWADDDDDGEETPADKSLTTAQADAAQEVSAMTEQQILKLLDDHRSQLASTNPMNTAPADDPTATGAGRVFVFLLEHYLTIIFGIVAVVAAWRLAAVD